MNYLPTSKAKNSTKSTLRMFFKKQNYMEKIFNTHNRPTIEFQLKRTISRGKGHEWTGNVNIQKYPTSIIFEEIKLKQ